MAASADIPTRYDEDDIPLTAHVGEHPLRLAPEIANRLSGSEQAAFFCTVVDSAVDAIIAHRPDGCMIWANHGAEELLGYSSEEILQLPPYGWVAPCQREATPRRIERILRAGRMTFDSFVQRKDGSIIEAGVSTCRVDTALGPIIVSVVRDISEWAESNRRLEHLAYHDALTGVANRPFFDERLRAAIADSRRFGDVLGLAYLDLDDFKPVNDRLGHDVGDEVLAAIGGRLREEVRVQDTVARIGGDEFVMVLPRLSGPEELGRIAARLVERVKEPVTALGNIVGITATVGLACFDAEKDDARSLLVKADVAMYAAKKDPQCPWLLYFDGMPIPEGRLDK